MRFRIKEGRSGRIVPLGEALMSGLDEYELKESFYMEKLRARWSGFAGDIIATHSVPDRISGNVLFITADHSIFANELSLMKDSILNLINEDFGFKAVKDIRILVGRLDWTGRSRERRARE
ncbi:MAG: DUF721 domain-containing protein [Spirochaetes bacterium]|jgi:predicted nucleic acid-binding Zn ribbon protein|nr:DUF721 domain-containing protein [Spirochaetota bacterium]